MADQEKCIATVNEPPHYFHTHRCERNASTEVGGHKVCGIHARVAMRWQREDRLDRMVANHWGRAGLMAALEQALAKLDKIADGGYGDASIKARDVRGTVRAEVERLVEDLEEERAVSRDRFAEVERLQRQLEEAWQWANKMECERDEQTPAVAQLRQALEAFFAEYDSPDGQYAPTDDTEVLMRAALAGSVPATDTDSERAQ